MPPPPRSPRDNGAQPAHAGCQDRAPTRKITPARLTQSAFAAFGTVIENRDAVAEALVIPSPPRPRPLDTADILPADRTSDRRAPVPANQNTALKHANVSLLTQTYATRAPSRVPGAPVMNMFSCYPARLRPGATRREDGGGDAGGGEEEGDDGEEEVVVRVSVLERHPFTTQTFIPLGLAPADAARYLVVVAPPAAAAAAASLHPPRSRSPAAPSLMAASEPELPRDGDRADGPDVARLRAFVAHGGQAVTYGEGTWHAPMVVVGWRRVDFVVVQACNGVGEEECEEWEMGDGDGDGDGGMEVWMGIGGGGWG